MKPSHSPYSYSFNNPISYTDPSGLAPEKEKGGGNKIQIHMFQLEKCYKEWSIHCYQTNMSCNRTIYMIDGMTVDKELFMSIPLFAFSDDNILGGYGINTNGGGGRLGQSSYWYVGTGKFELKGEYTDYIISIWTNLGLIKMPTRLWKSGIAPGRTADDVMGALVNGINDVQQADPGYFDGLYGGNTTIEIDAFDNIYANGDKAVSKHFFDGKNSIITLAGDVLTGDRTDAYTLIDQKSTIFLKNPEQYLVNHQPYSIIAHEFAHAIQAQCDPYSFLFQYNSAIREDFEISMTNRIRTYFGDPLQYNPNKTFWSGWNAFWFPNTWGKYIIRGY